MITRGQTRDKRIVLAHWKRNIHSSFEVFSNLKVFCQKYPEYNYNTLNNYLSKEKTAFENDKVRIERKTIISKSSVKSDKQYPYLKMERVVRRISLHNENENDSKYWRSKTREDRLRALYFIVSQHLKAGQKMDKSVVRKTNMHAVR